MEDNLRDMRVSDISEEDDVGLSRIRVNVRRQDSTIDKGVKLGMFVNAKRFVTMEIMILEDEFLSFLRINFPHYNEKMVTVPGEGFQYKLPGNQHGIPSKAKEIRLKMAEEEKKYEMKVSVRLLMRKIIGVENI